LVNTGKNEENAMHFRSIAVAAAMTLAALSWSGAASAQLLDRKIISLSEAKKMVAASEAEAVKNKWNAVIAVVDESGSLILLHKMDDALPGSVEVAQGKARTAALFRRPTKAFEDGVKGGRNVILKLSKDITPVQGGVPVSAGGRVVGAIGVSGMTSEQDEQVAKAGADLVK
jgi:glc operon protein GlcG